MISIMSKENLSEPFIMYLNDACGANAVQMRCKCYGGIGVSDYLFCNRLTLMRLRTLSMRLSGIKPSPTASREDVMLLFMLDK